MSGVYYAHFTAKIYNFHEVMLKENLIFQLGICFNCFTKWLANAIGPTFI